MEGARLVTGGHRTGEKGYYIERTILANVKMKIANEEISGPILLVVKFKTLGEVVKLVNNTSYGLAVAIFAQDNDTINTLSRSIKSKLVCVNSFFKDTLGGYKMSGISPKDRYEGLFPYLRTKSV